MYVCKIRKTVPRLSLLKMKNIIAASKSNILTEAKTLYKKLHNEELHDFYSSPSIIRMIKSRRMRWVGHVVRMGVKRNAYRLKARGEEVTRKTKT
jgi:glutathionyl-hydroquinone reductase